MLGNPPYINKRKLSQYSFSGFVTDSCPDIFAPCMERAASMTSVDGSFAMIVPIAFQFSDDYKLARQVISRVCPQRWVTSFSRRPSALFDAGVRPSIVIGFRFGMPRLATTSTRRWQSEFREHLFSTIRYQVVADALTNPWIRIGSKPLANFQMALKSNSTSLLTDTARNGYTLGFEMNALYYLKIYIDVPPVKTPDGSLAPPRMANTLNFKTEADRDVAFVLLSGRIAFWWWASTGDDLNLTKGTLESLPISVTSLKEVEVQLIHLAKELRRRQKSVLSYTKYRGNEIGNYDMTKCRDITDQSDQVILEALGLSMYWSDLLLADAQMSKSTAGFKESEIN